MDLKLLLTSLLIFVNTNGYAFDVNVPIDTSKSGSFYVPAVINSNIRSQFLVDTGAGMITLNRKLFEEVSKYGKVEKTGKVEARLANGKYETMNLYKVQSFSIGKNCNLGEMEVAVMKHKGRNILGLSALIKAAPFAIHTDPMELILSGCPSKTEAVADNQKHESPSINEQVENELLNMPLINEVHNITSTTSPSLL